MDFSIQSLLPPTNGKASANQVVDLDPAQMVEDFAKLLVAQITNQDPDNPMDPSEIITQNAQFLSSLATARLSNQASHYEQVRVVINSLGKTADYIDPVTQAPTSGVVTGGDFSLANPTMIINGDSIPLDSIFAISN